MAPTGRSSYAASDTPSYGEDSRRLKPPAGLPKPEKAVFLNLILAAPSTQFLPADLPLVVRYCELVVLAARAAEGRGPSRW